MKHDEDGLARLLFGVEAVKFGEFRLKLHEKNPEAPLSPIYIDLRILRSFPATVDLAAHACLVKVQGVVAFDYVADVPTAATPIAVLMSNQARVPMVSPRLDAKTHGLERKIDGVFKEGSTVLLVDDLITTATSKLEVISILEGAGLSVHDVVVLVDREQGGVNELRLHGYSCHAVFTLTELLDFYVQVGYIDGSKRAKVRKYLKV